MIQSFLKKIAIMILTVGCPLVMFLPAGYGAAVSNSYPGYPNAWDGLTTNSIIKIDLDEPVAMIGGLPDMVYQVKAATFNGFDMVLTDVACDVEVSGDGKLIRLYPQNVLGNNAMFAYKIENINFEGGGSSQTGSRFYTTGDNPAPLLNTFVDEGDMCDDIAGIWGPDYTHLNFGNYCARCHPDYKGTYVDCVIAP